MSGTDMQPVVITRAEAKARGLKRYYTGKPCRAGHVARRWLVDGACVECNRARLAAYRAAHPERVRARLAAYRAANADKVKTRRATRYAAHPERERARVAAYLAANLARARARKAAYRAAHPEKHAATQARRRARKLAAECICCTRDEVDAVWHNCPPGHEVDHIVPLRIGGRHCLKNLQYLSEADHLAKTAREAACIADWRFFEKHRAAHPATWGPTP